MTCKACKKRDMCITLCTYMEKYLSKFEAYQQDFTFSNEDLAPILEHYLEERQAPWQDRHSAFQPELKRRMKNLSSKQKKIIKLHFYKGLSKAEIARELKVTETDAAKRLNLAIEKLKKQPQKNLSRRTHRRGRPPLKSRKKVQFFPISRGTRR